MTPMQISESIAIARPPDELYALVSDVTRTGEWSPICKACWWDEGAVGQVGSWFTGRNETAERTWQTRSQVVAAEPGREFAWEVNNGWVRWGYTLEPDGDGTRLTESWVFHPKGLAGFGERYGEAADEEIQARRDAAATGIPITLAAIKRAAEGS
ncbi:MAG: SRPBCC family protein [Mycobacterium sp.]